MSRAQDMARAKAQAGGVPDSAEMKAEQQALKEAGFAVEPEAIPGLGIEGPNPFLDPEAADKAAMQAAMAAETPEESNETEKEPEKDPIDLISELPDGPSKNTLEQYKATYPEVLFLPLTDKEVYVYRPLTHIEWHQQIKSSALMQDQDALKDAIVARCILWPKYGPAKMARQKAGLRDLLYEVVMQSSYFIDPREALALVNRL
jgi:hypothetical protein